MSIINNFIQQQRESYSQRRIKRLTAEAKEKYQIRELGGQVWLTYNGNAILPQTMLKDDAVIALSIIRDLYVGRNK